MLHILDFTLTQVQHIYLNKFTYLEKSRSMMVLLVDINARLASVGTGITHIQTDIDKIYIYSDTLMIHSVSPLLLSPSALRKSLENIKRGMTQHPQLALSKDPNIDISSYYELLQINPVVFDDHGGQ